MAKMKSPEGNIETVSEESIESLSKAGWTLVNETLQGAAAPGGTQPAPSGTVGQSKLTRTVDEDNNLKPGEHEGYISKIEPRSGVGKNGKEYAYLDMYFDSEGKSVKAGYPDSVQPSSMLGKLLERFGAKVTPGAEVDIEGTLTNKVVLFQTTTDEKGYTRVDRDTVKPKEN